MLSLFLWTTSLLISLVFIALITALSEKVKYERIRIALPWVFAILLILSTAFTLFNYYKTFSTIPSFLTIQFFLSLTLFIMGAYFIIKKGRKLSNGITAAKNWPTGKIFAVYLIIAFLKTTVILTADHYIKLDLKTIQNEALATARTVFPPPSIKQTNAEALYLEVINEFDNVPLWIKTYSTITLKSSPTQNDILSLLKDKEGALAILSDAASNSIYYTPLDLKHGSPIPNYRNLRYAAITLSLRARLNAGNGDIDATIKDLTTIRRMSEHIAMHYHLISAIGTLAIHNIYINTVESVLTEFPHMNIINAGILTKDSSYLADSIWRSFLMENKSILYNMALFYSKSKPSFRVNFYNADIRLARDSEKTIKTLTGRPFYETINEIAEWDKSTSERTPGIFFNLTAPTYHSFYLRFAKAMARQELTNLALMAKVHKTENSKYLETLSELTPKYIKAIPIDPLNGIPLRSKGTKDGMILYSVGYDGVDNDGCGDDITFKLGKAYGANMNWCKKNNAENF
jgi:hypothetical protein